jgi:PAS domain S-box-containing protein
MSLPGRLISSLRRSVYTIIGNVYYTHNRDLPFYEHHPRDLLVHQPFSRYGLAILISVVVIAIKYLFDTYIGESSPYLLMALAILLSSFWGGLGPGLLSTLITSLAASFFQNDRDGFAVGSLSEAIQIGAHAATGIVISGLIAARNLAQIRTDYQRKWLGVMLASIGDAVVAADIDGMVTYINPVAQELLGKTYQQVFGKKIADVFRVLDGNTREPIANPIDMVIDKGEKVTLGTDTILVVEDGQEIPIDDSAAPIIDDEGELKGVVMVFRDITERRKSERELAELTWKLDYQNQKLNSVISSVPGIVWEITINNTTGKPAVDFVSNYAEKMLGYSRDDLSGSEDFWSKVIHPEDFDRISQEFAQMFETGKEVMNEFRCIKKNGEIVWVQSQAVTIMNSKGKVVGIRGVTTDITERKELEKRKDQFIGMASHELKTPITTIKVFSQMMEKELSANGSDMVKYAHKMNEQINKLTRLISDLLDISRIETGKLSFEYQWFDLDELVASTVENMLSVSRRNKIQIARKCDCKIYADRERIGQVLINLLTNAIKFSPAGSQIVVDVTGKNDLAVISVQDFGIGISREYQAKVFDRFIQVEEPIEKTFPGLGIGLYITSEIVKRHGGKIWVKSEKGEGSTFYFTLPLAKKATVGKNYPLVAS